MPRLAVVVLFLSGCVEYALPADRPFHFRMTEQPPVEHVEHVEDRWVRENVDPFDLLLVMDDSSSMDDNLEELRDNLWRIADPINAYQVDARVAITTTDCRPDLDGNPNCDPVRWFTPSPSLEDDIRDAFNELAYEGNDTERGFLAAVAALSRPSAWMRVGIPLQILFVSDEPDQSSVSLDVDAALAAEDQARRGSPGAVRTVSDPMVSVSAVIPDLSGYVNPACTVDGAENYGELADRWGGTTHNLCSPDWGTLLDQIVDITPTIEVPLHRQPILSTVKLHALYDDVEYTYVDRDLWHYRPMPNSIVVDGLWVPEEVWVEYDADY